MTTNSDFINDTARKLFIINYSEVLENEQAESVLRALNRMMSSWIVDGIDIGWYEQTDLGETLPIEAKYERGVMANLALEIAPDFESVPTPQLITIAQDSYNTLAQATVKDTGRSLNELPGTNNDLYDIRSG